MSKQILCNICLANGTITEMLYDKQSRYYVCPKCKATVVPKEQNDKYVDDIIIKLMRDMHKTHLPAACIPAGEAKKGGGGGSSKGRSRKGDMSKKSLSQINTGLNGKCMSFESR
jgi:hypothetical protein